MDKIKRQNVILNIINNKNITSQSELTAELRRYGVNSTQATVSRDLKELNVIKVSTIDGFKYSINEHAKFNISAREKAILSQSILSIDQIDGKIVIKTLDDISYFCGKTLAACNFTNYLYFVNTSDSLILFAKDSSKIDELFLDVKNYLDIP